MSNPTKRFGLRLNQGNASNVPHTVPGWPGFYRPDVPTPVGGEGDALTLKEAKDRLENEQAAIDAKEKAWNDHEAAVVAEDETRQVKVRPHGPLPFGDWQEDENGEPILVKPTPPLELVEIPAKEVAAAEAARDAANEEARNGLVAHKREPKLNKAEKDQIADDREALKEA